MAASSVSWAGWEKLVRQWIGEYGSPLLAVLTTMLVMVAAVVISPHLPGDQLGLPRDPRLQWFLWDAPHYLSLARHGYQTTGLEAYFIAFFPFLPVLIWLVHWVVLGHMLVAGYVVAFVASVGAAIGLYELVKLDDSVAVARRAVWLLMLFPTALYFHLPYTESVFLALVIGALLAARRGKFGWAMALATCATATRVQGLALVPALVIEVLIHERWRWRRPELILASAITPLVGFGAYLLLNVYYFGSPVHFLSAQKAFWETVGAPPWVGLVTTLKLLDSHALIDQFTMVRMQIVAAVVGLAGVVYAFWRLRLSYAVYALGILLISTSTERWVSVPRYLLVMFPIFIMMARWGSNRLVYGVELVLSGGLFVGYVLLALWWWPVF